MPNASPEESRLPQRTQPALLSIGRSRREQRWLHEPPCGMTCCLSPLEGRSNQSSQNPVPDELSPGCRRAPSPPCPTKPSLRWRHPHPLGRFNTPTSPGMQRQSASCSSGTVCFLLCNSRRFNGSRRSTKQRLISQLPLQQGRTMTWHRRHKGDARQQLLRRQVGPPFGPFFSFSSFCLDLDTRASTLAVTLITRIQVTL